MRVFDYLIAFDKSDKTKSLTSERRRDIAIYGISSEIGSVVAAIKKKILSEEEGTLWNIPNAEIIEEIGDVMWYCFLLAGLENKGRKVNIFSHDIENLRREVSKNNARAKLIEQTLGVEKRDAFLEKAKRFPRMRRTIQFSDYQEIAFLTARTERKVLAEVCMAVLGQLSAELLRKKLPPIEMELNRTVADRPTNDILGEISWHISAVATLFNLSMNDVASQNMAKITSRWDENTTALHDEIYPIEEQFPRRFDISFVSLGNDRSRMYLDGKRLGDDLTDNSYRDDGYRFHDVMHLANVAILGWSPVLRGLLRKKRKSKKRIDEVEDGARAGIVEEAVIKAIHSEGQRLAGITGRGKEEAETAKLFERRSDISFQFLKQIKSYVSGLEVEKNTFFEWERTIIIGHEIFYELRRVGQGTVSIDMNLRSLTFTPEVFWKAKGPVAGIGQSHAVWAEAAITQASLFATDFELGIWRDKVSGPVRLFAYKRAILDCLGYASPSFVDFREIEITEASDEKSISVKARGGVRQSMWKRGVVGFLGSLLVDESGARASVLAIAAD